MLFIVQMSSTLPPALKMCSLTNYQTEIRPTVCFVSLGYASGTKNIEGIIPTFETFKFFARIRRYINYRLDAIIFTQGHQNVFLDEVSNRNNTHGVFCIPRLRLGHKKHLGYYSYIYRILVAGEYICIAGITSKNDYENKLLGLSRLRKQVSGVASTRTFDSHESRNFCF